MYSLWEWITENRLIAMFMLVWVVFLVTPTTWYLFFVLATEFNMAVATAYGALMGLPPAVFAWVMKRIEK